MTEIQGPSGRVDFGRKKATLSAIAHQNDIVCLFPSGTSIAHCFARSAAGNWLMEVGAP